MCQLNSHVNSPVERAQMTAAPYLHVVLSDNWALRSRKGTSFEVTYQIQAERNAAFRTLSTRSHISSPKADRPH